VLGEKESGCRGEGWGGRKNEFGRWGKGGEVEGGGGGGEEGMRVERMRVEREREGGGGVRRHELGMKGKVGGGKGSAEG